VTLDEVERILGLTRSGFEAHDVPMASNPPLSKEMDLLLRREASMAAMSLGLGLTFIRRHDFVQTGYFYSGLYSVITA
jgi:hypothetical protein